MGTKTDEPEIKEWAKSEKKEIEQTLKNDEIEKEQLLLEQIKKATELIQEQKPKRITYKDLGPACRLAVVYSLFQLVLGLFVSLALILTYIRG